MHPSLFQNTDFKNIEILKNMQALSQYDIIPMFHCSKFTPCAKYGPEYNLIGHVTNLFSLKGQKYNPSDRRHSFQILTCLKTCKSDYFCPKYS